MRRSLIFFGPLLLCLSFGTALGYDKLQGRFPPVQEMYAKSVVVLSFKGTGEWVKLVPSKGNRDFDKSNVGGTFSQTGMGVVLSKGGHQYIVTNAHVIVPIKPMGERDPVKLMRLMNYVLLATDYYGRYAPCPVTIAYRNDEYDLALLRVPDEWAAFKSLPIPIGLLSRLEPEDALSGILNRRNGGERFGNGKADLDRSKLATDAQRFTMSMRIRHGDSGSPIIAYDNGKPVFLGIATAYLEDQQRGFYLSIGTRVDILKEVIPGS